MAERASHSYQTYTPTAAQPSHRACMTERLRLAAPTAIGVTNQKLRPRSKTEGIMYQQNYDPTGNVFLSTIVAAIPILTLLYFIALHRYKDSQGTVRMGISAPYA